MIIDSHVHIYPPEVRDAESIVEREPYFRKLTSSRCTRWGTAEDLLGPHGSRRGGPVLGLRLRLRGSGGCAVSATTYVLEAAERSGAACAPAVVPPLARGAMGEIERAASRGGHRGGGTLSPGTGLRPDGPAPDLASPARHEGGLFALVHTAEPVGHDYPGKGDVGPREAAAFCEHHPETPVVFAHFGGGGQLYEQMPEMRRILSNAWYDTAAALFLYRPGVFDALFAFRGQVLYGSDFPAGPAPVPPPGGLPLRRTGPVCWEATPSAFSGA